MNRLVSLGANCVPAWHIRRLKLGFDYRLPFDTCLLPFDVLIRFLKHDFPRVWSPTVRVSSYNHEFSFSHRKATDIPEVMQSWNRRVERFRQLRDNNESLTFIRSYRTETHGQKQQLELENSLTVYGFKNFKLRFIPCEPAGVGRWYGTNEYWNRQLLERASS